MVEASLRVHIVSVGFEVIRATDPILRLHADRVILLTTDEKDAAREYLLRIRKTLDKHNIVHTTVYCNTWDTNTVVGEIGAIVRAMPRHQYFVSVCTGPTPARIGGTVAGMLWPVRPYYVAVDYSAKPKLQGDYPTKGNPKLIATFEVNALDEDAIRALAFLADQPQPVSKGRLRRHLEELKIVRAKRPKKEGAATTPQAFQAQVNVILEKLRARGFVELAGKGAEFKITVTEKGQDGYKMYRHVTEAPRVIDILRA